MNRYVSIFWPYEIHNCEPPSTVGTLARRASAVATGWPSWRGFLTRAFHPDRLIIPREPPANPRQLRIHPHRDDRARERECPSEALLREAPQQLFPETCQHAQAVCWGLERHLEILVDVLPMLSVP